MKNSLFENKISLITDIRVKQEKIKQIEREIYDLKAREKELDAKLYAELRDNNLSRYICNDYEFSMATELTTAILDSNRKDALKYDRKFNLGLFRVTLNGMRLKAWVKDLLAERLEVPRFVSYQDFKTVQVREARKGN